MSPSSIGEEPRDSITVIGPYGGVDLAVKPGINPQIGSSSVLANSIRRVVAAPPGWLTVAELPPATPV